MVISIKFMNQKSFYSSDLNIIMRNIICCFDIKKSVNE